MAPVSRCATPRSPTQQKCSRLEGNPLSLPGYHNIVRGGFRLLQLAFAKQPDLGRQTTRSVLIPRSVRLPCGPGRPTSACPLGRARHEASSSPASVVALPVDELRLAVRRPSSTSHHHRRPLSYVRDDGDTVGSSLTVLATRGHDVIRRRCDPRARRREGPATRRSRHRRDMVSESAMPTPPPRRPTASGARGVVRRPRSVRTDVSRTSSPRFRDGARATRCSPMWWGGLVPKPSPPTGATRITRARIDSTGQPSRSARSAAATGPWRSRWPNMVPRSLRATAVEHQLASAPKHQRRRGSAAEGNEPVRRSPAVPTSGDISHGTDSRRTDDLRR